ncbi:hypothetical protein PT287_06120 [Lactobacillus sp. ESL0679]|nr:hypothetical protein [Lactobacillus sp. ESL0679]
MANGSLVDKFCFISNPVKQKVIHDLTADRSLTKIVQVNNVPTNTVLCTFTRFKKVATG